MSDLLFKCPKCKGYHFNITESGELICTTNVRSNGCGWSGVAPNLGANQGIIKCLQEMRHGNIYDNNHPWSKKHKDKTGGYCFQLSKNLMKIERVSYESYCGHGGGGNVWSRGDYVDSLVEIINKSDLETYDLAFLKTIMKNQFDRDI